MGYIGLLLAGWDGRNRRNRRDGGGMERLTIEGDGLGAPPLDLEVRQTEGSGGCHNFHWCSRGCGVLVSDQKSNHNTLHKNPSCNIVQDSGYLTGRKA